MPVTWYTFLWYALTLLMFPWCCLTAILIFFHHQWPLPLLLHLQWRCPSHTLVTATLASLTPTRPPAAQHWARGRVEDVTQAPEIILSSINHTLMLSITVAKVKMWDYSLPSSVFYRENGEFEEVIVLPSHSRLSPLEGEEQQQENEEGGGRVPVIAFTENGLLKPLSGVEDISAQQGPGH